MRYRGRERTSYTRDFAASVPNLERLLAYIISILMTGSAVERSANGDEPLEARRNFGCRYAGTGECALKKNLCHKPSLTVREQRRRGQWIDVLPRLHFSA